MVFLLQQPKGTKIETNAEKGWIKVVQGQTASEPGPGQTSTSAGLQNWGF